MKTVNIQPAVAFANGQRVVVTQLHVKSVSDNLFDHVIFRYTLMDEHGQHAGEGAYELKGVEQYQTWDASASGAYTIVAKGLKLEILPVVGDSMFGEV